VGNLHVNFTIVVYDNILFTGVIKPVANKRQELIKRWDSERELLRSAPGSYPNSLK